MNGFLKVAVKGKMSTVGVEKSLANSFHTQ